MPPTAADLQIMRRRERAFRPLIQKAFADVKGKYGDVTGKNNSSEQWLPYHGITHTVQVKESSRWNAEQLAEKGIIEWKDVPLAELAGAWHDQEQLEGPVANERTSGERCVQAMRDAGLFEQGIVDETDAQKVLDMIDGTAVKFDRGAITARANPKHPDHVKRNEALQAAVADADMAGLGSPNGPMMRVLLFAEMQSKAGKLQLPNTLRELYDTPVDEKAFAEYMQGQVVMDENHEFLTEASRAAYGPGFEKNAEWTRSTAESTKAGTTTFGDALRSAHQLWLSDTRSADRGSMEVVLSQV